MPTIFTVYEDDSIQIDSFDSTIKTTAYRKINDTADLILNANENVKAVFIINEMWRYTNPDVLNKNYDDRVATESPTALFSCHMTDKSLKSLSYYFEGSKMSSFTYLHEILSSECSTTDILSFMYPISQAFASLHKNEEG